MPEGDLELRGFCIEIPVEVESTPEGTKVTTELYAFSDTPKGARELAERVRRRIIEEGGQEITGQKGRGRFFGFSDWSGSTWQPEGTLKKPYAPPGSSRPELN